MADDTDTDTDTEDEALTNGIDPELLERFVKRVENVQADLDQEAFEYKERCAPLREDIAQIKREAADKGIGKKEFAAVLRRRRLEHKAAHVEDTLDLAQRANYRAYLDSLDRLALEIGPLGQAAADHVRARAPS